MNITLLVTGGKSSVISISSCYTLWQVLLECDLECGSKRSIRLG